MEVKLVKKIEETIKARVPTNQNKSQTKKSFAEIAKSNVEIKGSGPYFSNLHQVKS